MSQTKKALLKSVLSLVLCVCMCVSGTFAWFSENVTSDKNIIKSGNLDIEMYWTDDLESNTWYNVEDDTHNTIFAGENWEPGYTEVRYIKVVNKGSLALNYEIALEAVSDNVGKLAEVINVYCSNTISENIDTREELEGFGTIGLLQSVMNGGTTVKGTLLAANQSSPIHKSGEAIVALALQMVTSAGNEYQNQNLGDGFKIKALAHQCPFEEDTFGADYDGILPEHTITDTQVTVPVTPVDGKIPTGGITLTGANGVKATVPAGAQMKTGATDLTMKITPLDSTGSGITVVNNEVLIPVDVHIEGLDENNTVPVIIDLGPVLPKYLNMGNYTLIHVENGVNETMTRVDSAAALKEHNQFTYDLNTGDVSVAMATFSEVALIADTANAWEGNYDYSWYTNAVAPLEGEATAGYAIANADQLAGFGAIVGGMNGQTQDSFSGKTVKLLADINLGDAEDENNSNFIFHPIGYYYTDDKNADGVTGDYYSTVNSFEGTFDGNGHTVSNFYQNTWEIKGDYDGNYYKDAMGLFGYVVNGTVKNLTVDHFSSDGEFTPTGVIAAYAANSTFENIAITNCNPRVYNTGNGGIVGIGGNSDDPDTYKLTFTNITIDNTNKISALWGSWDVACGGLVGMFRGAGHVYMTNCHVAAQIDVFNDVCGNYQYYWYRYSGMMVGTNKNMTTDANGYTVPETDKFHAEGCTVHFGNWNDYYYCELVANSLASYTHDHQFSRLEQIQNESEIKDANGNWKKSGNFILMSGKTPTETCYHIVNNSDGTLKRHLHTDAGEETVNGETVLKENNQIVYLPFNQLFTGYGWGVKHIPVYNGENYAFEGIKILDREVADSVEKFAAKIETGAELVNNKAIKLSELFKAATIADEKLSIQGDKVQVTVSPVGEDSTVSGTYVANTTDWKQGTLAFAGVGAATITITDYYFCTPTTINVTITERVAVEKFETKFKGNFLYRVGNANGSTVALGTLFNGTIINNDNVSVTIENVKGNASGTYTQNATWTNGTIQFNGIGVVKVTITDNDHCTPTELILEVVDAKNHSNTTISSLGSGNVVLLTDTKLNNNGALALQNASLYGNGFEIDVTAGRITGESVTANYLLYLNNGTLDNVNIKGAVYTKYGALSSDNYNNPVVLSVGNSTISDCKISNCASPVRVRAGNIIIRNSELKGGNFANLDIRGGKVTLDNVTTINQIGLNDKAADGTEVVGLGIVTYYEGPGTDTSITIKGELKQYNSLSKSTEFNNSYAKILVEEMFSDQYSEYHYKDSNQNICVNTGVLSMSDVVGEDNIINNQQDNKADYFGTDITFDLTAFGMGNAKGYLYSVAEPLGNIELRNTTQNPIEPKVTFDHTVNELIKQDGSEMSCTSDSLTDIETITFADGDSFEWKVNILKCSNKDISYTVWMDGTQYTDAIVFDESGTHEITFKYVDENNYQLDSDGNVEKYAVEYEKTMSIIVNEQPPTAKNAEITFPLLESYRTTKVVVDGKTYIMPNLTGTNIPKYGDDLTFDANSRKYGSLKADGKTNIDIYYPIIKTAISGNYMVFPVFGNKNGTLVQIQDYDDGGSGKELTPYNASTQSLPTGLSVSRGYTVQWDTDKDVVGSGSMNYGSWTNGTLAFKYQSSSDTIECKVMSNYLSYYPYINLRTNDRNEQVMVAEYKYVDNKGDTFYYCVGYHIEERNSGYAFGETVPEDSGGGCVTPDTLITLADGSQKRIDEISYADQLLVWDFFKGEYATVPASAIINHGYDNWDVISLTFDDGTVVDAVNAHAFFDADVNEFVLIDTENAESFIGHEFVKTSNNGYTTAKLVDVSVSSRYTGSFSLVSALHYNFIVEDMFSLTNLVPDLIAGLEVGEDMKYNELALKADIEKYGLYSHADFEEYVSEDVFEAFNGSYLKISVGKGYITYDEIVDLILRFVNK